tara:strand:+ start:40384 stop:41694 length:1311 start_codon:yes stop_codon:yes gene_type:complete
MPYDIILGRDLEDRKKFGKGGASFIGRGYVKMGQTTSLSNNIFLDVNKPHVILVTGKRGSGKSTTLGVMAEEMSDLPEECNKQLAFLMFDTMGIFWTMKYKNERQKDLLQEWGLEPKDFDVKIFTPKGFHDLNKRKGLPSDKEFSIKTKDLNASDWANAFNINLTDPIGVLIERVIKKLQRQDTYSIQDIIDTVKEDKKSEDKIKNAVENRFLAANEWGLFEEYGTEIKDLIHPGQATILDLSPYTSIAGNWSIKGLVVGLISKRLIEERIRSRKFEELEDIKQMSFESFEEDKDPLIWVLIDEAHELLPKEGKTPATDALVQLLREGRQPGISLVLATQQPGEIHKDVLTQSDIVISHRLTSKIDVEALNNMMQTYLLADIQKYMNELPDLKGSAIVLDDNSERIYPIRVHPKKSWHGGETPSILKDKEKLFKEL